MHLIRSTSTSQPHYALANPLATFLDKPPDDFTREDLLRVIEQQNIERVTFHYTAIDGKLKELQIPVANRQQAEHILADGERVDGSSLFAGLVDVSLSDLYVVPVYRTAFLNPFDPGSLDLICRYMLRDGRPAPFAPDNILKRALEMFRKNTGHDFYALGELEFFLLSPYDTPLYPTPQQRGYHASSPFIKTSEIIHEMVRHITQITGAVKYAHSEVGNIDRIESPLVEINGKHADQLEIEFLPTPVDVTGDHLMLARWLIRNIAYQHGCVATFAPKLEEGVAGNGMHVHMELRKDGKNAMIDDTGALNDNARRVIGGLCTYADSLTAFGNTVSAAYLRLVPHQEAPTRICWSDSNRSALIRVPLAWSHLETNLANTVNPQQKTQYHTGESRQTVELRSPDGSAMVHLLLAGITMAAEWGLTHDEALQIAAQTYATGNIFQDKEALEKLGQLPGCCAESARLVQEKRALYEREAIFPPSVIDYASALLQAEDDETLNQRLAKLAMSDRQNKTREIMHSSLHRH